MTVLFVTGTGTDVGKTFVTAAIASLCKQRVAVLKPAQTGVRAGEPGDVDVVASLAGDITTVELARYPDPLAPRTAARRSQREPLHVNRITGAITELQSTHDVVLVEGAGGLLVQFDEHASTLADVAMQLDETIDVQMLVVVTAGLGTLNTTALTAEALRNRRLACMGIVIGRWPASPDLASCCNLEDLPLVAGAPLLGVLPDNLDAEPQRFRDRIADHVAPALGGRMDVEAFQTRHANPSIDY